MCLLLCYFCCCCCCYLFKLETVPYAFIRSRIEMPRKIALNGQILYVTMCSLYTKYKTRAILLVFNFIFRYNFISLSSFLASLVVVINSHVMRNKQINSRVKEIESENDTYRSTNISQLVSVFFWFDCLLFLLLHVCLPL